MNILNYFSKLYNEKRELSLLQWTYIVIGVVSVLVAGILALFNQGIGTAVLVVPLAAFVAMSMNIVAWALIKLAADSFLAKKDDKKTTKKK